MKSYNYTVSADWVLNQLAGMRFTMPVSGPDAYDYLDAYDYMKQCIESSIAADKGQEQERIQSVAVEAANKVLSMEED